MGLKYQGGCLLERFGITALSDLEIDVDKNWQAMGITRISQVAAGMAKGDMAISNGTVMVPESPGVITTVIMSRGEEELPMWVYEYLPVAFPMAAINITDTTARIRAVLRHDCNETCEGRFRWREVGAAIWTETAWGGALVFDDVFHEDLIGLTPATLHEFQCRARHDHGTGPWSDSRQFTTLP